MPLHDLFADCQAEAGAGNIAPVEAPEQLEDLGGIAGLEPDTVVCDRNQPFAVAAFRANFCFERRAVAALLDRVRQ